jgi:hypothetical protein
MQMLTDPTNTGEAWRTSTCDEQESLSLVHCINPRGLAPGFKKPADFSENHRNSVGSGGFDFKNHRFFELKFRNFEKKIWKNYVKN